jgi:hypothetical protein
MKTAFVLFGFASFLLAQDSSGRITVPFSDASRPRVVQGSLLNGCFTVEGYDGKDVIIETKIDKTTPAPKPPRGAEGMRRIRPAGPGLTVEEEGNVVQIHSSMGEEGEVLVRVPWATSLKLNCTNGGDMKVSRISGNLELQNVNGAVTATNISGSVVAHALNGKLLVGFDKIASDKAMSFTSMNGDVDVTLPSDTRGTLRMKSDQGEIFTDFDVKINATASAPVVEDGRAKGGKYRVKLDQATTVGTINGGGPDMTFKTVNGNVYIRAKK